MSSGNKFRCSPCALFHPLKAKKPDAMMESGFLATQSGKTRDACLTRNPRRTRAKSPQSTTRDPLLGIATELIGAPSSPFHNLSTDGSRMSSGKTSQWADHSSYRADEQQNSVILG